MLGLILLPVVITFFLIGGLLALTLVYLAITRRLRLKVASWVMTIGVIAFIPSCVGVQLVLADYMFGDFHYAAYEDIDVPGVDTHLPSKATNIDVASYPGGYKARFQIAEADLDEWFNHTWEKARNTAADSRREKEQVSKYGVEGFEYNFEKQGWSISPATIVYNGPIKSNGAGYTIWFDAENNVTYQSVGYW